MSRCDACHEEDEVAACERCGHDFCDDCTAVHDAYFDHDLEDAALVETGCDGLCARGECVCGIL